MQKLSSGGSRNEIWQVEFKSRTSKSISVSAWGKWLRNDLEAKRITTNQFCAIWSRLARFMAGRGWGRGLPTSPRICEFSTNPPHPR